MTGIDYFALFVLFLEVVVVVVLFILFAAWPGKVAAQRNHPQAQAIKVGGWAAAFLLFVLWPLMLVWAFTTPASQQSQKMGELESRNRELEEELKKLGKETGKSGGSAA